MTTSIITGDIINSRNASTTEIWLNGLKKILKRYGNEPKNWEIYRGDSFQVEISDPAESLFAAILIKASIKQIKNLDVRLAIGIGDKTYSAEKISESNGSAFVNSGNCFENLKGKTLAIKTPWYEFDNQINTLIDLAALTMNSWGSVSSEVTSVAMLNPTMTQKELAQLLKKKSQSTISESLKRGGYEEILQMEKLFRNQIKSRL